MNKIKQCLCFLNCNFKKQTDRINEENYMYPPL